MVNERVNIMDKLQNPNPELFTYENWESRFWDMLGFGYMEEENLIYAIEEYGIGYCDFDIYL